MTHEGFSSIDEYESVQDSSSEDENPPPSFNPFSSPRQSQTAARVAKKAETAVKCCYENQRYWIMSGWHPLTSGTFERPGWSDVKGLMSLPKKNIKPEKGW